MSNLRFDSRDCRYKSIPGAARAGDSIIFRLSLPRFAGYGDVWLASRSDRHTEFEYRKMERTNEDETGVWFSVSFSYQNPGVYWYHFEYDSEWQRHFVLKGRLNQESEHGTDWQQTVYDPAFETPDWVKGGVIYQIFPDRFCASGKEKAGVPGDRFLCGDWGAQPAYLQGSGGRVLGNDYFGGDLAGITQKLPYLRSLGVTILYLNPIFEAHSNHRYNTADYCKIDPLLGSEEDFRTLCAEAEKAGIRIILDGVFSHTGSDSIYFNKEGRYEPRGAFNSQDSPYYGWYKFEQWPHRYAAWWGVPSLPEVREEHPDFCAFITGENGVIRRWIRAGASGFRLDVADELPDDFLDQIRGAVKTEKQDSYLIGEVWEDASNKISYGSRRRFLLGGQLDSVMNYPFCEAIIGFLTGSDARALLETIETVLENYPKPAIDCLMNHIGTHDTDRILTALAGEPSGARGRDWQASAALNAGQLVRGERLVRLASVLQYTLPGIPSLYYGDEAGMEGYRDPFNRGCYPWGHENQNLLSHYRWLGQLRADCPAFSNAQLIPVAADAGLIAYCRANEQQRLLIAVNRGEGARTFCLPDGWIGVRTLYGQPPEERICTVLADDFLILEHIPIRREE